MKLFLSRIITRIRTAKYHIKLSELGHNSFFENNITVTGADNIKVKNNVYVSCGTWLASVSMTGVTQPSLIIKDNCSIGHYNHIYCTKGIVIEQGVLTADRVYISDNSHDYNDIEKFIKDQRIIQLKEVVIGEGSWLGENVCVIGANVGKHCVIGANSVVTKDIPDFSVAVGCPAKVIKRYNFKTNNWEKV